MNKQQYKEHIKRMMKIVDATVLFTTTDRTMDFEDSTYYSEIKHIYEMAINEIKNAEVTE